MACNCGKKSTAAQPRRFGRTDTQSFALTKPDGSKTTYGSRLEADAANARAGYTGIVKPLGS